MIHLPLKICNLSRIPFKMEDNPLYITSTEIIKNPNIEYKKTKLSDHCVSFNPTPLGDIYGVDFLNKVESDLVFIPWLHYTPVGGVADVAFVKFDAEQKVQKLKDLISSIQEKGFVPDEYPDRKGGITGYRLVNGEREKFYVVSGNHRVAILCALGLEIPYKIEDGTSVKAWEKFNVGVSYESFPAEFDVEEIESWPSVISGFLTKEQAEEIIDKYMEA